ncbi:hypothetical protein [Actinomadura keratinilytica]|uniref:hypothetical protein n=1 Tax=Actinomadura keratinilytica TaxID=547461 RepID=UPI003616472D
MGSTASETEAADEGAAGAQSAAGPAAAAASLQESALDPSTADRKAAGTAERAVHAAGTAPPRAPYRCWSPGTACPR